MAANDWSNYAKAYSASSVAQIPAFFANIATEKLLDKAHAGAIKFIDVAAGFGILTEVLINLAKHRGVEIESVTVTDFAEGMVQSATKKINELDAPSSLRKEFRVMDAQNMSYDDGSFTHLGCMFGIMFFPDRPKGLSEICRVLQPGGVAVIGTWNYTNAVNIVPDLANYAELPDVAHGVEELARLVKVCSEPEVFTQELKAAGFKDVEVHVCEQVFSLPNNEDTYMAFANNAVLKKALGGREPMDLYPKFQEYLAGPGKERWLHPDGMVRLHYVGNIAVARK